MHDLADSATGPDLRDDHDDAAERPVPARLADAVDLARTAAVDAADGEADQVGEALAVHAEDAADEAPVTAATHYFAAAKPGYRGWTWAVTVMVADERPGRPRHRSARSRSSRGRTPSSRRSGSRGTSGSARRTSPPATCCPSTPTTTASSPPT